jgi:hypothetical protein
MHEPIFYGLLYIDEASNQNPNLIGAADPIDVYVSCASLCSKAFRTAGTSFRLITNDEAHVKRRLGALQLDDVVVVAYAFTWPVPKNIPFYSAHFKLDIIKAFGRGTFGKQIGLVDLDAVLLKRIPLSNNLAVYDISDQVFAAYERDRVLSDMERISGRQLSEARWYGGEFVMGSAAAFCEISQYVELCWPDYVRCIPTLHHVGDEMIMSSALNMARADGVRMINYGKTGLVARWWTARTQHKQAAFDSCEDAALLHLPADKVFLARQARYHFQRESFLSRFRRYAQRKIALRAVFGIGESLIGRPKKLFTPILSSRYL